MNRWSITPEKFVDLNEKYNILWYLRLCYEPFHLRGELGIAEEVEKYIMEQGGLIQ